ncbi:MAG: hypothetical protein A2075_09585 [Geobacteraceae bacterium GWC2_58_44]|nr:MAG: hypothetical protein A2075_09585 [Geobacteraceae bacterium GWC2_58_44]
MKKIIIAAVLFLVSSSSAFATLIDFSLDSQGTKPNGFSSVSVPGVKFYDTIDAYLIVGAYSPESNGSNALAVFGDDQSKLQMVFASNANTLSLDFGNDQPGFNVTAGVLDLYLGTTLVGNSVLEVNGNDFMDQTISYTGASFDNAFFYYIAANGAPANLIEVVDNINFSNTAAPVPEPSTIILLGTGLLGVGLARRKRK